MVTADDTPISVQAPFKSSYARGPEFGSVSFLVGSLVPQYLVLVITQYPIQGQDV